MTRNLLPVITFTILIIVVSACGSSNQSVECDQTDLGDRDGEGFTSIDQLAWYSHQIVVGTVTEQLESRKVHDGSVSGTNFHIETDYLVQVEDRLRGDEGDANHTVVIKTLGGTVDGCTQTLNEWPPFEIGDRALFFLRDYDKQDRPESYRIFGDHQGYWTFNSYGLVEPTYAHQLLPKGRPLVLDNLTGMIRDILRTGPPEDDPYMVNYYVPLDDAPI